MQVISGGVVSRLGRIPRGFASYLFSRGGNSCSPHFLARHSITGPAAMLLGRTGTNMKNDRILHLAVLAAALCVPFGTIANAQPSTVVTSGPLADNGVCPPGLSFQIGHRTPAEIAALKAAGAAYAERSDKSDSAYHDGLADQRAGHLQQALADYKECVQIWPASPNARDAWYRSGDIYETEGDTKGAISAYLSGIYPSEPYGEETVPYWYFHCANLLWNVGRHEKAVAVYNEGEYQFNYVHANLKTYRCHVVLLPRADETSINDKRFLALCKVGMGVDYNSDRETLTNEPGTIADLKAATELDPTLAEAHFYYGYKVVVYGAFQSEARAEMKLATVLGNADVAGKADAWLHSNQWPKDIDVTPVDTVPPPSARNIP